MKADELNTKVLEMVKELDLTPLLDHIQNVGWGQQLEVKNISGTHNLYYQWLHCLMKLKQPKQVVELGSASGISTILMATVLPKDSILYSVDNDPDIAWKWMKYDYPQAKKILADDLNMDIWKDIDLSKTDIWFIDTLHEEQQLRKEMLLYSKYFKRGSIVIFDDIHLNEGMQSVWDEFPYDKCDNSDPCHYSGFGFFIA
jgi:cephalosporin hydroxylase